MLWVARILVVGAAGAVGYALGDRRGQRKVADKLVTDPDVGRTVLERLARRWGAKLELFDAGGGGEQ